MRFERKKERPIRFGVFLVRLVKYLSAAWAIVAIALSIGVFGYHFLESMSWVDSFLNAAMILGGMGPVNPLNTTAGKVFASFYALFSGFVFVGLVGFLLTPVFHRVLHKFHYEENL